MPLKRLDDSEETRSIIEEQSRSAQHEISSTQAFPDTFNQEEPKREKLAAISTLPVELLSLIFLFYIHDPELRLASYGSDDDPRADPQLASTIRWVDIMRVVRVCHTWRSVALSCPEFWSHIVFSSMEVTTMMLERSKTSPLYIGWLQSSNPPMTRSSPIANIRSMSGLSIDRIRELHIDLAPSTSATNTILVHICDSTTGVAEELLSMYIRGNSAPWYGSGFSTLFSTSMPNLQRLEIVDVNLEWAALLDAASKSGFSKLIYLKLVGYSRPHHNQLYGTLAAMPNLETLYLDDISARHHSSFSDDSGSDQESADIISLPNLFSLTIISSTLSSCVNFHTTVLYPATRAKLCFRLHTFTTLQQSQDLMKVLLRTCGFSEDFPRRHHSNLFLRIPDSRTPSIEAILWDGEDDASNKQLRSFECSHPSVILDFTSNHMHVSEAEPSFLAPFLHDSLFIPGLRRIGIHQEVTTCTREGWSSFFSRHPDVTHLHILADLAPEIIASLSSMHLGPEQRSTSPPISPQTVIQLSEPPCLPNLSSLILEDHGIAVENYDEIQHRDELERDLSAMAIEMDLIVNCMSDRYEHGLQLQELRFVFAVGWSVELFKRLAEVVVDVTWMGLVPPYQAVGDSDSDDDYEEGSNGTGEESDESGLESDDLDDE